MSKVALCYCALFTVTIVGQFVTVPVYVHMMVTTLCTIFIGSHHSVVSSKSTVDGEAMEHMSTKDAYMFPFIGSAVLFGLYAVFKFLPKDYVNMLLKFYFIFLGVGATARALSKMLPCFLSKDVLAPLEAAVVRIRIPFVSPDVVTAEDLKDDSDEDKQKKLCDGKSEITVGDVLCHLVGVVVGVWYYTSNHWAASNVFGISFSMSGIELLGLGSFFNAAILLVGLFFYDIFWVFGTDVMVTVAKSFDAPIKLLYPRGGDLPHSLLGLGDIVVPGIFVALLLRFDHELALRRARAAGGQSTADQDKYRVIDTHYDKYYFKVVMVAYWLGLTMCVVIMNVFKAAQPALLYLVPFCLLSSLGAAYFKGDLKELLAFDESPPQEQTKKDE